MVFTFKYDLKNIDWRIFLDENWRIFLDENWRIFLDENWRIFLDENWNILDPCIAYMYADEGRKQQLLW